MKALSFKAIGSLQSIDEKAEPWMGDVIAKSNEAEKAFERKIIKDSLLKDKLANEADKRKADEMF